MDTTHIVLQREEFHKGGIHQLAIEMTQKEISNFVILLWEMLANFV